MVKRIVAIFAIFVCTAIAWLILGSTIFYRTYHAQSGLSGRVASTWGEQQSQAPPSIAREWHEEEKVRVDEDGEKTIRKESILHSEPIPLDASRVAAGNFFPLRSEEDTAELQ